MTIAYPHLFSPGTIGSLTIPNRVVQLPMGTSLVERGHVTERDIAFQEERARGGVGLIITAGAVVHETSLFPERILTEAWDETGIEMLARRVQAVHRHGTLIFGQILHLGREQPGGLTTSVPLAPSPVASPRNPDVPHEMTASEIRLIVDAFGRSAANYQTAGYDGVEIHAAHGYLIAQFLSPASNRRIDAYRGDTLEGRARFLIEVIEQVRRRCGADMPVGVRLSAEEETPDGLKLDDTLEIVDFVQSSAPVHYVSVTVGMRNAYVKDSSFEEGFALPLAAAVKELVDVPVIVAGRFRLPDLAERALAAGQADFVGIGRAQLADPEWARKARAGLADRIRPCVGFVQDCRIGVGGLTCGVNARTGREAEWGGSDGRQRKGGRVVVVGAGPAGLETTRLAAECGHEVTLYEREDSVGGQVRIAGAGPTREQLLDVIFYLERELERLGVDVRRGSAPTAATLVSHAPDLVVVATGASPTAPAFPVDGEARVATIWDVLGGGVKPLPSRAIVVDDILGFWHGISAAEYLAERGVAVELITAARGIGLGIPPESIADALARLRGNGVALRSLLKVTGVHGATVSLADSITGEPAEATAELVAVRTPLHVDDQLARELEGEVASLAVIGDCAAPRRITHAILEANQVMRAFGAGTTIQHLWRSQRAATVSEGAAA